MKRHIIKTFWEKFYWRNCNDVTKLISLVNKETSSISLSCSLWRHFYQQYADPTDEPSSQVYDQTFEDYELSIQDWKGDYHQMVPLNIYESLFFRQNMEWDQKFQQHCKQPQSLWIVVHVNFFQSVTMEDNLATYLPG